jgi:hypothetical protein
MYSGLLGQKRRAFAKALVMVNCIEGWGGEL